MEDPKHSVSVEKLILASPHQIFQAFTKSTKLRHWLCQVASLEANENGRIYLAWDNGYYAAGYFLTLIPNHKLAFTWHGRNEPQPTLVTVTITLAGEKCFVHLEHSGMLMTEEWATANTEIEKGWQIAFENLVSFLETGIDLRISQRPLLGIFPAVYTHTDENDPVPVKQGIKITDVVEGYSAVKGGLKAGDILVDIEGMPVTDWNNLTVAITHFKAGDRINVSFYRGAEKHTRPIVLSQQTMPDVPETPQQLAEMLVANQKTTCDQLMAYIENIKDDEAAFKLDQDAWSTKEVVAHLIHSERDHQLWIHNLVQNAEPIIEEDTQNLMARVKATVALYPSLQELLDVLRACLKETTEFIANLPLEVVEDKSAFWYLAYVSMQYPLHIRAHFEQITNNLKLARDSQSSA